MQAISSIQSLCQNQAKKNKQDLNQFLKAYVKVGLEKHPTQAVIFSDSISLFEKLGIGAPSTQTRTSVG